MELKILRVFVELVRQGGFSAAAKTLNSTQSTVSKAIKQLEDEIGAKLLDRVGHKSILTSAGEVVYRHAIKLLTDREDLMSELNEMRGLNRGTLSLGLPPVGSAVLFAPLFAIYRQRYPKIDIKLYEHGSAQLEESLTQGEIDFAGILPPFSEEFDWEIVKREPMMAVLNQNHPLAQKRSIYIKDLEDTPFIMFDKSFSLHRIISDIAKRSNIDPYVVVNSSQIDFQVSLAAAGLGVAFLPRMIAMQKKMPAVRLVLLNDYGAEWVMAMAWRRGSYLSSAARAWLDIVREFHGTN